MMKRTLLLGFIVINTILYGIDVNCLIKNKIFYFLDCNNGCINKINVYSKIIEPLPINKVPLFLMDFCWGKPPTYIFCEDKKIYNSNGFQVKSLLSFTGKKCIYITLQNGDLRQNSHTITCLFPDWPGLDNVSKTAAYDDNRGIMLFPLIPENPKWYIEMKGMTIYTDFWDEFNNCVLGERYVEKPFYANSQGHLCIALPCLVNYYEDILSFFCPMKNAGFSLDLQTSTVRFSDQLRIVTPPRQCTFCMDIWTRQTRVTGISVQVF